MVDVADDTPSDFAAFFQVAEKKKKLEGGLGDDGCVGQAQEGGKGAEE